MFNTQRAEVVQQLHGRQQHFAEPHELTDEAEVRQSGRFQQRPGGGEGDEGSPHQPRPRCPQGNAGG